MVRITNDVEGKVTIGLLEIDKGKQAEKEGVRRILKEILGFETPVLHNDDGKPMVEDIILVSLILLVMLLLFSLVIMRLALI